MDEEEKKRYFFQKDIEEEFDLRAPTVTSIIQNLEKTNYVKKELML
ncbi:MAG: MarR family transcriptional regulator [Clostridium sp.]|nr:MAG: MarR family transcriptional regulator [Clostridium sp.]